MKKYFYAVYNIDDEIIGTYETLKDLCNSLAYNYSHIKEKCQVSKKSLNGHPSILLYCNGVIKIYKISS